MRAAPGWAYSIAGGLPYPWYNYPAFGVFMVAKLRLARGSSDCWLAGSCYMEACHRHVGDVSDIQDLIFGDAHLLRRLSLCSSTTQPFKEAPADIKRKKKQRETVVDASCHSMDSLRNITKPSSAATLQRNDGGSALVPGCLADLHAESTKMRN